MSKQFLDFKGLQAYDGVIKKYINDTEKLLKELVDANKKSISSLTNDLNQNVNNLKNKIQDNTNLVKNISVERVLDSDGISTASIDSDIIYQIKSGEDVLGTINIPKDLFVKTVRFDEQTKNLEFVFETTGGEQPVNINMSSLTDVYTSGNGLSLNNKLFSVKIDPSSSSSLSVSNNGLKLNKPIIDPIYSDPSFNWDTMTGNYLSKLKESFNKIENDNIGTILFVKNVLDRNDYDEKTGGAIPVGADVNKWLLNKDELLYLSSGDIIVLAKNSILNLANIRGFILRTKSAKVYDNNGNIEGSDGVMTAFDKFQVNDLPAFKEHVNNNIINLWNEIELPENTNIDTIYKAGTYRCKHTDINNGVLYTASIKLIVYPPVYHANGYSDILQEVYACGASIFNGDEIISSDLLEYGYRTLSRRESDGYINPGEWKINSYNLNNFIEFKYKNISEEDIDKTYMPGTYNIDGSQYYILKVFPPLLHENGYLDIKLELTITSNVDYNEILVLQRYISRRENDGYINPREWVELERHKLNLSEIVKTSDLINYNTYQLLQYDNEVICNLLVNGDNSIYLVMQNGSPIIGLASRTNRNYLEINESGITLDIDGKSGEMLSSFDCMDLDILDNIFDNPSSEMSVSEATPALIREPFSRDINFKSLKKYTTDEIFE